MDETNTVTVTLCCYCLLKLGQAGAALQCLTQGLQTGHTEVIIRPAESRGGKSAVLILHNINATKMFLNRIIMKYCECHVRVIQFVHTQESLKSHCPDYDF